MTDFKLINEDSRNVTYAYRTDYDHIAVYFDKELKSVNMACAHFVLNSALEPQWKNETDECPKYSCKYGHWQSETIICLSAEDIEFINNKCKELFR